MKSAYGVDFAFDGVLRGLDVVAEALNRGDLGRAMVATALLGLRELDREGAARITLIDEALVKYNYNPAEPRDRRGRWTQGDDDSSDDPQSSDRNFGDEPASDASSSEVKPDTLTPIDYMGFFHDQVVADFAKYLESKGEIVETEVRLRMADGSGGARLDILALDPQTNTIYGVELKTGVNPGFTPGQLKVYPHLMWGGSVMELDGKGISIGLLPNVPLRPIPIYLMYQSGPGKDPIFRELNPSKMARYYRGH